MKAVPVMPIAFARKTRRRVDDRDVVDLADVGHVLGVMRRIALPRRERIPTYRRRAADRERCRESRAAVEAHQRRRIHGARNVGARAPAPAAADLHPTSVVERCEAPRCVVDPRVAPGRDIRPATIAIGHPIGLHVRSRVPHGSVVRVGRPATVGIEIFITGHPGRHIARCLAVAKARLARHHPVIERHRYGCGRSKSGLRIGIRRIACCAQSAAGVDEYRTIRRLHAGLPREYRHAAAILERVDPIAARLQQREVATRRCDVVFVVRVEAMDAHRHAAAHDIGIEGVVVELLDVDLRARVHRERGRADTDFGAAGLAHEHRVARRDRLVHVGQFPFGVGLRIGLYVALHISDAPYAAGNVGERTDADAARGNRR